MSLHQVADSLNCTIKVKLIIISDYSQESPGGEQLSPISGHSGGHSSSSGVLLNLDFDVVAILLFSILLNLIVVLNLVKSKINLELGGSVLSVKC